MQFEEVENCTFQTAMAPVPDWYPFAKEGKIPGANEGEDFNPKAYIDRMGKDFSKRHPEIFKFGKIRKARRELASDMENGMDKCISTLCDAFDLTQVYMKFEAKKWKIWNDIKKLEEEEKAQQAKKKT